VAAAGHDPLTSTGEPRWLVTCSCGWERACSSEWAARSVSKLVSGIGVRTCLLPLLQADSRSGGVAPTVSTAGFPDSTVRESRDWRVRGDPQPGPEFPIEHITVNLAPADERLSGRP
jgi:hypothetical protein